MSREIAKAVFDRWNNAGLDVSIATLYAGAKTARSQHNVAGPPAETDLPRAEYSLEPDNVNNVSRGSRIKRQPIRFQVWYRRHKDAGDAVDLIEGAYVNSEQAGTSPLVLPASAGVILGVEDDSGSVHKQDDEVFQGVKTIVVLWRKNNTIPS